MIFVTVGTQNFQFTRLFKKIDELIKNEIIQDEVFAQIGKSKYHSELFETRAYISPDKFENLVNRSTLIISHGGTSSIIKCLERNKKVIVVPRLREFNEHVDNHQLEITNFFAEQNYVEPVYDIEKLGLAIKQAIKKKYKDYVSNKNNALFDSIKEYIKGIEVK